MRKILESIGGLVFGVAVFLGILFLVTFFVEGGVWLGDKILPWLFTLTWMVFGIDFLIVLPLGIFEKTKGISAVGLYISSYIYGLTLWFWALLITYFAWGFLAVFIGLFVLGIGVVPIAIVAAIFKGEWGTAGAVIVLVVLTYGSRSLGYYIAEKADEIALNSANDYEYGASDAWTEQE